MQSICKQTMKSWKEKFMSSSRSNFCARKFKLLQTEFEKVFLTLIDELMGTSYEACWDPCINTSVGSITNYSVQEFYVFLDVQVLVNQVPHKSKLMITLKLSLAKVSLVIFWVRNLLNSSCRCVVHIWLKKREKESEGRGGSCAACGRRRRREWTRGRRSILSFCELCLLSATEWVQFLPSQSERELFFFSFFFLFPYCFVLFFPSLLAPDRKNTADLLPFSSVVFKLLSFSVYYCSLGSKMPVVGVASKLRPPSAVGSRPVHTALPIPSAVRAAAAQGFMARQQDLRPGEGGAPGGLSCQLSVKSEYRQERTTEGKSRAERGEESKICKVSGAELWLCVGLHLCVWQHGDSTGVRAERAGVVRFGGLSLR